MTELNTRLSSILLVLIACGLFLACFLPIQTDEVLYKLVSARLFADDGELIGLFPQCKESFSLKPPALWFLPRALDGLIYGTLDNIFLIRILGVGAAAVMLGLLCLVAKQLGYSRAGILIVVPLFALDTMLLAITINRPEQNLVITLTMMVLLYLAVVQKPLMAKYWRWAACFVFVMLANVFFALHPKAFMLLPVVLVLGWIIAGGRSNTPLAILVTAACVTCAFISVGFHIARADCTGQAAIQAHFSAIYLSPRSFMQSPLEFMAVALINVLRLPEYFLFLWYTPRNTTDWLPVSVHDLGELYQMADSAFSLAIWLVFSAFAFIAMRCVVRQAVRGIQSRSYSANQVIAIALLGCMIALASIQTIKMFYEIVFFLPLFILIWLLAESPAAIDTPRYRKFRLVLLLLAVASLANIMIKYAPYVTSSEARTHDRVLADGDMRRLVMADTSSFVHTKQDVLAAAAKCKIATDGRARHVVTDMLTYPFFIRTFKPLSIDYLIDSWYTEHIDIGALSRIMRDRESSGMVTLCAATPDAIRNRMTQTGDFCCLGLNP